MKKTLIVIWTLVLLYAIYTFANYKIESKANENLYKQVKVDFYNSRPEKLNLKPSENEVNKVENKSEKVILEAYNSIVSTNKDVVGWIKVPSTSIDYPVLKGTDNDFYLNHNINKKPSSRGSIFMDFRNNGEGTEPNTIIYGHNMKDGSMFGEIKKYKSKDFLKNNSIIEFNTLYETIKWEIFSVYVTDVDFNYIKTDFNDLEERGEFIESLRKKSIHKRDVKLAEDDSILTLSTCSYEFDNARLVIHAKRIK